MNLSAWLLWHYYHLLLYTSSHMFFYCCHMVNKYINKPDLMFSMYSCTSVQPVYILTGGLRVTDVTQSFSSLLLYAWIYSCHSSPTSSTGHNMPHWDVLIKSLRCHHNLTFSFLSPHSSFSWENKTTPPITPATAFILPNTNNYNSSDYSKREFLLKLSAVLIKAFLKKKNSLTQTKDKCICT